MSHTVESLNADLAKRRELSETTILAGHSWAIRALAVIDAVQAVLDLHAGDHLCAERDGETLTSSSSDPCPTLKVLLDGWPA